MCVLCVNMECICVHMNGMGGGYMWGCMCEHVCVCGGGRNGGSQVLVLSMSCVSMCEHVVCMCT